MDSHHHWHTGDDTRRMRRVALSVIVPAGLVTLVALIWLWPSGADAVEESGRADQFRGVVVDVENVPCPEPPGTSGQDQSAAEGTDNGTDNGCGTAWVRLSEGADKDKEVQVALPNGPGAPSVEESDKVVLITTPTPDGPTYAIVDHQRSNGLWLLAIAFVLAVIAFARWRGLSALIGLAVTFVLLLLFVVPAILAGESPLLVAIVGSAAIMLTVLYLTHGFAFSTSVAVLGTLASLTLTGVLASVSVASLHLTGFADESSTYLGMVHSVNTEGLLLAGIVIGSLGVLDDVTVTQAATVTELARANPDYRFTDLYCAGTRVGRSHIASVINTIVLAYAGSSLPLLILISANDSSLGHVVSTQVIAQEIVRSVVATLGLIAAVPITTALAAATARTTIADAGTDTKTDAAVRLAPAEQ
ncbi:YibE/F family protein [Nocardioides speluncae]|uniref:YibE/F family protein n=1 Tax=Nocardioides speluncae TaxID=2670337 RepID=UPI00197F5895|nr:YibE/F family protein [Nocardioides speluncae]